MGVGPQEGERATAPQPGLCCICVGLFPWMLRRGECSGEKIRLDIPSLFNSKEQKRKSAFHSVKPEYKVTFTRIA